MSADNFVVVRRFEDGWRWGEGSATHCVEKNMPFEKALGPGCFKNGPFDTMDAAANHAEKELGIIEYGIVVSGEENE